jgi:hemerythrin-like domain-containing protein
MIMITRRREFLAAGAALGISGLAGRTLLAAEAAKNEADVSALEDLMREHGVLRRILLIFEESVRQLHAKKDFTTDVFHRAAVLIRKFIEDYHEKLEENFIFPEFEKHDQLVALVKVLREQHAAGRAMTDVILKGSAGGLSRSTPEKQRLEVVEACEAFIRMYRPHAAREDTVLFPALHKLLPAKQLDELGDKFEDEENRRFGNDGFGKTVEQVAAMERELGIYDLGQFTAKPVSP